MNETLILGGAVLAFWLVLLFLRVPSSIAFLSLLIGQLLASEASQDVYDFVDSVANINNEHYLRIGLLLLPLLLTILILRNRVPKHKIFIEAIPLLLLSALTAVLLAPILSDLNVLASVTNGQQIDAYKSIVVVAASASGLLSAWLSYPRAGGKHHGKHSK